RYINLKTSVERLAALWVFLLLILGFSLQAATSDQSSSSGAKFDGPAELPREYVKSSSMDTPAAGKMWMVRSGQSIEQVLAGAACGDIIQLQAGATFSGFLIPAKSCDDSHWIVIRTSAPDSSLPPEGTRLNPCYGGVSSLPGRPQFNCGSTANVLAKIESNGKGGSGPLTFSSGANHYRLIGLELTRAVSPLAVYNLVQFKGPADHLVFDRLWIHGTPQDDTVRGILLGQTSFVAIVDSFFNDFHCVSKTGSCVDSQAVAGGLGDGPMGPYKIVNNFLEAAGEDILLGGGQATATPHDIEVRHNHMFKPMTWMKGQPGFVGGANGNPFIIKNIFELKNGQRILLDGNIMENTWGGFTQVGFAILITPKNQAGGSGSNLCPICQVTDVNIRNSWISHVGAGLQIANASSDNGGAPRDGQRYSIHDIVIDDIDGGKYTGPGEFAQLSVGPSAPLLQNVAINHVTAFPSRMLFVIGDMVATMPPMKNFAFVNNIVNAGSAPVWSTGGGPGNCAFHNDPLTTFSACFSNYTFTANAIIAAPAGANWPKKNFFPRSAAAVGFANYNGGNGGDYHLQASSPYKGKGTDGKDLGADVDAIDSATAGVE
ncbi:MAG: hypothetical protein WBC78_12980, partial [Candidatus Sulfotelmatobacter sp.]